MTAWFTIAAVMATVVLVVAAWYYARSLYASPWVLLLGPADADRTALLSGARDTAVPRGPQRSRDGTPDLSWHYFDAGAVVDVGEHLVFPRGGHDAVAWERVLRLLRRYRPRRPVDGVILALPAARFLDPNWLSHAHELGAALRDRLVQAQRHFGFAVPVYVVVTQCDAVRGFTVFTRALPPALLHNMLGWSNPRASSEPYASEWIADGFASLHRRLVLAQVELFAMSSRVDDASSLLLFPRDVMRLMTPLRALLDETFRPGLYEDKYFLRGFYLCGEGEQGLVVADGHGRDLLSTAGNRSERASAFTGDLLERKVFVEQGLATPLPAQARAGRRRVLVAQAVVAALAIVLAAGTAWSYVRVQRMRASYADVLTMGRQLIEQRRQLRRGERRLTDVDRLAQSRQLLERLQALDERRLGSVFMPASQVWSLDTRVSDLIAAAFGEVVLGDFRDGLTHRAAAWLVTTEEATDTSEPPDGPSLESNPDYQALDRFATDYQGLVENVRRYERLARGADTGDLSAASELLAYLGVAPLASTSLSPAVSRAAGAARAATIDCRVFESPDGASLVGARAAGLLASFGSQSFGDENPLVVAGEAFDADWTAVRAGADDQQTLLDLIGDTTALSAGVAAWAPIGARSDTLALPVLERAPFQPMADARLCAALRPDLSASIGEVVAARNELSDRLLSLEVEPFGAIVVAGAKGLELNEGVGALRVEFDNLQREAFWSPAPADTSGILPPNPSWSPEVFDEVVKVADAYDIYRARAFGSLSVADRQRLLAPVRSEVSRLVSTRLVLSAATGPMSPIDSAVRLDEIAGLGAQLAKATRLVPLLAIEPIYGAGILRALDGQSLRALQDLDGMGATRYPAVFARRPGDVFVAWTALENASPGPEALKAWLAQVDESRSGIQQLARLAQPIARYAAHRQPTDVVRRWNAVVADVDAYEQKRPGSGFAAFDAVLREDVPAIVPERNCAPSASSRPGAQAAGFFAALGDDVVDEGVRRCWGLVESRYSTVAASFNRLLAGKAPFSRTMDAPEATPGQVIEFLRVFENQAGGSLRPALEARACSVEAVSFVRDAVAASALLEPLLTATPPVLALDVVPEFRAAPGRESGGDQVAQWQMEIGSLSVSEGTAAKAVQWTAGDRVAVAFRFARDSPNRPVAGDGAMQVLERSARFEFSGRWALLHLLRAGRSTPSDLERVADLAPTMLAFRIPVERDPSTPPLAGDAPASPFRVYMRLRVSRPGSEDSLPLGDLPAQAPAQLICAGRP